MKVDWLKIRYEYIKDVTQSLEKLAEKYGVSHTAMKDKSREDGWVMLRDEYQILRNQKFTDSLQNSAEKEADKLSEKSKRRAKNWNVVQTQLLILIRSVQQSIIGEDGKPKTIDLGITEKISKILNSVTSSLKDANLGERLEDGQPLTIAKSDISILGDENELQQVSRSLRLTDEDFFDDKLDITLKKIADYYAESDKTKQSEDSSNDKFVENEGTEELAKD